MDAVELRAMQALAFPESDPFYGANGPLIEHWLGEA